MSEETTEKPDIIGKPISELSYSDFRPYINRFIIYTTKAGENGERIPTKILAVEDETGNLSDDGKPKSGTGLIKLLEQGNWRNYDFLVGKK
jgi:hypothetical protein